MATVEFIQKRIEGKEKELARLIKKLARIRKAEESNWENNPYYYSPSDIASTERDIKVESQKLEEYRSQLKVQLEKEGSRDVKPILEFLESWKAKVFDFYSEGLNEYFRDVEEIRRLQSELNEMYYTPDFENKRDYINDLIFYLHEKKNGRYEQIPKDDPSYRYGHTKRKVADGEYEFLKDYFGCKDITEALVMLNDILTQEANAKYDDIIERTNAIVGQITDADYLSVGPKGELNGFIEGTKGKASVTTIGAGGYNIQVYHFRTLIRKVS